MRCPTLAELPPPPEGTSGWPWTIESPQLTDAMPDGKPWPRISIVTPSYNQGRFIEETIRSVLLQGYPDLEYIIIDGASTDNAVTIIKKYEPWLTYWVSEKDCGQSHAINKGFERATGEWGNWLNSDDMLVQSGLLKLAELVRSSGLRPDVVSFTTIVVDIDATPLFDFPASQIKNPCAFLEYWQMPIPQPSTFVRCELLRVNDSLHYCMDWALYFDLAAESSLFAISPARVAMFRQHSDSKTALVSNQFEREKIQFILSRVDRLPTYRSKIREWVRTRESRLKLNERHHSLASLTAIAYRHPNLLRDRMFWGYVKQLAMKS